MLMPNAEALAEAKEEQRNESLFLLGPDVNDNANVSGVKPEPRFGQEVPPSTERSLPQEPSVSQNGKVGSLNLVYDHSKVKQRECLLLTSSQKTRMSSQKC